MKKIFSALVLIWVLGISFLRPAVVSAGSGKPILLLSPEKNVVAGTKNTIQFSLVNMGVPLKRVEAHISLAGNYNQTQGFSFAQLNTEQYGIAYRSHYFTRIAGSDNLQELVVIFEATQPEGYNQGSGQIPLAEFAYVAVEGYFSAMVLPDKTKLTDIDGNLVPAEINAGVHNYLGVAAPSPTSSPNDLQSYNLSFAPINLWWPTAPNTVQQIDAAIWKDSDGDRVKYFKDLKVDWQVDANYLEVIDTASQYFDQCPMGIISPARPCIRLAAHVVTKRPGKSEISVRVTESVTNRQTWNSAPIVIYSLSTPTPQPGTTPTPVPASPYPTPSFIPQAQVSAKEFKEIQQKVTYLQTQLGEQEKELKKTNSLLNRVIEFLRKFIKFK